MPLTESVSALFTEEWARFQKGVGQLDPETRLAWEQYYASRGGGAQGAKQINIPGFGDVIRTGPRYQPTQAERAEFWAAQRAGRPANISEVARGTIEHNRAIAQGIRNSAQPGYAQAFGTILTAIDNVQDLASSIATFGRLGLWGVQRALNSILPGASTEVARALARQAGERAALEAASTFAGRVVREAAAGNLAARLALADKAIFDAAGRAFIREAEAVAFRTTFRSLVLGGGARLAGRIIPVVGWVLLAADLLNLLSFVGLLATPAYALICRGPTEALAAGVPVAVFKGALKRETWSLHSLNPFSRQARAARRVRAAGRLPTFSNLIEVAQTTETLWGWGVSLGGLTGAFVETAFSFARAAAGEPVTINPQPFTTDAQRILGPKIGQQSQAERAVTHQAATVAATAPSILAVQEVFDEELHLLTMIAYREAVAILSRFLRDLDWQGPVAEAAAGPILPIVQPTPGLRIDAAGMGLDLEAGRRWWFPHSGSTATGEEYALFHAAAVPRATRDFLAPRRNAASGAAYGGLLNATTEGLFWMFERDPDLLRWELTTDARLVSSLTEEGFLIGSHEPPAPLWRMWQAARARIEVTGRGGLQKREWIDLAERHGVTLIPMLPPEAPWPEPWHRWAASLPTD